MPRILLNLTDDTLRRVFTDADLARLAALGENIRFNPKTDDGERFAPLLAEADVTLTCWGSRAVSEADVSGRCPKPLLVAHAAGSVRGIVPKDLLSPSLRLTQGAAAMVPAVAQLTIGFMVMALRQAQFRSQTLGSGSRDYSAVPAYRDLTGLTVGLVGLSRIGQAVANLLPAFGVGRILAYDPYAAPDQAQAAGVTLTDLDSLLSESDVVSLHAPVTPETRGLVNARRVGLLQGGSVFINTARSELTDQTALFARAIRGEIQLYTDVTTPEPLPPTHEAWQSPHIFITPHIAGPTAQTLRRMAVYAIDEIERFLSGQPLQHEVTAERYDLLA